MAEKATKKKINRKAKRRIRKTAAALLLISAITVAAIPVPEAAAATTYADSYKDETKEEVSYTVRAGYTNEGQVTTDNSKAVIPTAKNSGSIYTSTEGFQFANISDAYSENMASLLGYSGTVTSTFSIPSTVNAYLEYGTNNVKVAANKDGKVLYYREKAIATRTGTVTKDNSAVASEIGSSEWAWGDLSVGNYETDTNTILSQGSISSPVKTENADGMTATWTRIMTIYLYKYEVCAINYESDWWGSDLSSETSSIPHYFYISDSEESKKISDNGTGVDNIVFYMMPNTTDFTTQGFNDSTSYVPNGNNYYNANSAFTGVTGNVNQTYIDSGSVFNQTSNENKTDWLKGVPIGWISDEQVTKSSSDSGGYVLADSPRADWENFFNLGTQAGLVVNLELPDTIYAIADYAFYDCYNITDVNIKSESIIAIGKYAFAHCRSMSSFTMPSNAGLNAIAEGMFDECRALSSITIPNGVKTICDNAFRNCYALSAVNYGSSVNVSKIGNNAFENCTSLTTITLPESLDEIGVENFKGCTGLTGIVFPKRGGQPAMEVSFSNFNGCQNLEFIEVSNYAENFNSNTEFLDDSAYDGYSVESFIADVGDKFYFSGWNENDAVHEVTAAYSIAYYYREKGIFEKIVTDSNGNKFTYWVDESERLVGVSVDTKGATGSLDTVVIPGQVGKYPVSTIGTELSNNLNISEMLTSVTIPTTVKTIEAGAFKGCTKLKEVIFEEPNKIVTIGDDAFKTQGDSTSQTHAELKFCGLIDPTSQPFLYAMENTYTSDKQADDYIDFYSEDQGYLHVKYNPDTGYNELWNAPMGFQNDSGSLKYTDDYYTAIKQILADEYNDSVSTGNLKTADDIDPQEVETAVAEYEEALDDGTLSKLSQARRNTIGAAYNLTIPVGVESIREGLFSVADEENTLSDGTPQENASKTPLPQNTTLSTVTMQGIEELDDYAFYGCENLEDVVMYSSGAGESIGAYAFAQCPKLSSVVLPDTLEKIGSFDESGNVKNSRPFAGDKELDSISFVGVYTSGSQAAKTSGDNFEYSNWILYELEGGARHAIVECLEGCSSYYAGAGNGNDDFSSVSVIYPEAFMNCGEIGTVDLSESKVAEIPEFCFADMTQLTSVSLPLSCKKVDSYAFKDTNLKYISVPYSYVQFDTVNATHSFYSTDDTDTILHNVTVSTPEGSSAESLATAYTKYGWEANNTLPVYTISYYYRDLVTGDTEFIASKDVEQGSAIGSPENVDLDALSEPYEELGRYFKGWTPVLTTLAGRNMDVYGEWDNSPDNSWKLEFVNDKYVSVRSTTIYEGEKPSKYTPPTPESAYAADDTDAVYTFKGWVLSQPAGVELGLDDEVTSDIVAVGEKIVFFAEFSRSSASGSGTDSGKWTATFVNDNAAVLSEQSVEDGGEATAPYTPTSAKGNYKFTGWSAIPSTISMSNVTGNVIFVAQYDYTKNSSGNTITSSSSSSDDDDDEDGDYYVRVIDGGGSGYYDEGDVVTIQAYDKDGYEFEKWMSTYEDLEFSTETSVKSGFLMPKSNVVVTATYKYVGTTDAAATTSTTTPAATTTAATTSGTVTRVPSSSGGSNSDSGGSNSGTTVQVNRNGISDTGKASATVNGSTDNFVVKVSEDGQTTAAVAEALKNKYGDLSNIRYFAMDISLYDETGTSEITDTSGLSVTITLPIPDELRQYAGNNKVGAVSSGNQLEELTPRFATVDGTPCVTFTATHFSPYTIYVDTANLSSGAYDSTPKTGDAIHPKWFLAAGLALLSAVLFLKKDKKASAQLA